MGWVLDPSSHLQMSPDFRLIKWYSLNPGCQLLLILKLGSETGWNLGPGTLCCSACIWTNIFSSNKIQRNYKGLKITVCMHSWGKLWTARYKKTKKPNRHF